MLVQCWPTICDTGPASNQHWFNDSSLLGCVQPSKHKTFVQCWTNVKEVVPTLYKCYTNVLCLLGIAVGLVFLAAYCWPQLQADTDPMAVKCRASVAGAGQYPFCPSQYFILRYLHAGGIVRAQCFAPKLG